MSNNVAHIVFVDATESFVFDKASAFESVAAMMFDKNLNFIDTFDTMPGFKFEDGIRVIEKARTFIRSVH